MKSTTYYQRRRYARQRWSRNAVRKRELLRLERATSASDEPMNRHVYKPRPDLKVNLERKDGGRVQFRLHYFNGRLIGQTVALSPKQFGRKLGEIFALWIQP